MTLRVPLCIALMVIFLLPACAVNKLGDDLNRADDTYGYIRVAPIVHSEEDSTVLVVLFGRDEQGMHLINYRSLDEGADAFFLAPLHNSVVVAFEDLNGDWIYQVGEPAASSDDPAFFTEKTSRYEQLDYDNMPATRLKLLSSYTLPVQVDLSPDALKRVLRRDEERNQLRVTNWDDPAFSADNVAKGLWQPLTFAEETGFGLYLLEELDPDKQPLLLVHGINGSPLNFKDLAEQLDPNYQLLLYQYPSGFPLEHSAYVLYRAVADFLKRHDYEKLDVLAHSMGGLVSRGLLTYPDEKTNAKIGTYITLATPWSGHDAARMGVKWSPNVAPVWKSMVPNSKYLQLIFSRPLPETVEHHLFFAFSHQRNGASSGDDGVVTVKSQLKIEAQREATAIYGVDDNHNGILGNPCAVATIQQILAGTSAKLPSCIPAPSN